MYRRILYVFFAAVVFAAIITPTKAADNARGSLKANIDVNSTTNISNNTTLAPGEYKVITDGNQAKFEKDGKVVAEVPCSVKTLPSKASQTEVHLTGDRLQEIQISGKTQAIEFSSSPS